MTEKSGNVLPPGTKVGNYLIEKVLGSGGFGVTYLAVHTLLKNKVALKECLPSQLAYRRSNKTVGPISESAEADFAWALERFIAEARTLAQFKHPAIVRVHDVFEENGTAYMPTEYEEGMDLEHWLAALGRRPTEEEIVSILNPILEGLELVHKNGILHRDISPDNIYMTSSNQPLLLDFGSARHNLARKSHMLSVIVKEGFAPFEQYQETGNQGPWTDIYALCATVHFMITGEVPASALNRVRNDCYVPLADRFANKYNTTLLEALDNGLVFDEHERIQGVKELKAALEIQFQNPTETVASIDVAADKNETTTKTASAIGNKVKKRPVTKLAVSLFFVGCVLALLGLISLIRTSNNEGETPLTSPPSLVVFDEPVTQEPNLEINQPELSEDSVDNGNGLAAEELEVPETGPRSVEEIVKEYAESVDKVRRLAESGNANAQYNLALRYANGEGVKKDVFEANKWYRLAAEQGLVEAQVNLGFQYSQDFGIPLDYSEAIKWYSKAAEQDHPLAQRNLGIMYLMGTQPPNHGQALRWFKVSAEQGDLVAQTYLGRFLMDGIATNEDDREANKWFQKAGEQGHIDAQFYLGLQYAEGNGVVENDIKANQLFRKAAEQGDLNAQFSLGSQFAHGEGVIQDWVEAHKWFRMAAERGQKHAQYNLGYQYATGTGVEKDEEEAIIWYKKAAEQGHPDAAAILEKMGL